MTSNLLRTLVTLFGFSLKKPLYYRFMASPALPWKKLWSAVWRLIPSPITDGYLIVALDDCINTKVGKKIFACETVFDHAAKDNQSNYVWAQNFVCVGLLKIVTFKTKMEQSANMILSIAEHFSSHPVLVVADSWFGNNGLYKLLKGQTDNPIYLLSRLRANNNLFALPKTELLQKNTSKPIIYTITYTNRPGLKI